ncbi:MAG: ATP-grasp domain-containing protein [Candidatus Sulfotelmatobacter sp.]
MKPTVLIATTSCWYPTARLAMALASAGCKVEMVCPTSHPARKTKAVSRIHIYRGLAPLTSFARAIATTQPDFIVSGDDLATQHLHRLYAREKRNGQVESSICAVIERSLGSPESFPVVNARTAFMNMAHQEGLRVPPTRVLRNIDDLRTWVACTGLPTVLKADGTSGGDGVRIARTLTEAELFFKELQAPPLLARAAKRALVDQDKTLVWPSLLRRRPVVNAQAFVAGLEATSAVVCWQGAVLASLHFEVVNKASSKGHATVVRLINNAEMSAAAEKMALRLCLSGFYGFDFMLESETGNAYLVEINPRSTQVGHLSLGPGRDIPAALYAALSGKTVRATPKITEKDTIALFPQEWIRDAESPFLRLAYHDIPMDEPELIRDCVSNYQKQSAWYSKSVRKPVSSAAKSSHPMMAPAKGRAVGLDWGRK